MTVQLRIAAIIGCGAIASFGASVASAAPAPPTPVDVAIFKEAGAYVFRAGNESLPLYTFDKDRAGKSTCNGHCAVAWPPLAVTADGAAVGDWSIINRDDGARQWAWRGKPVYTYAKDSPEKPTGDGVGGVWRLIPTTPAK